MLSIWSGPHGGLPPWDELHHDFQPLFETAIADALAEFTAIVDQPEAPTRQHHCGAGAGRPPTEAAAGHVSGALPQPWVGDMPEIEQAIGLLVAYDNQVSLNQPLFAALMPSTSSATA